VVILNKTDLVSLEEVAAVRQRVLVCSPIPSGEGTTHNVLRIFTCKSRPDSIQGQNLAVTVLYVAHSLGSGVVKTDLVSLEEVAAIRQRVLVCPPIPSERGAT